MPKRQLLPSVLLLSLITISASAVYAHDRWAAQANPVAPESNEAFRGQLAAIVQSFRAGDAAAGRKLIEQFRLPNPEQWFSEHLGPEQSADLARRYDRLYANFAESLEHTVEAIVANGDSDLVTSLDNGRGETPGEVRRPGAKLSGMVSSRPAPLFYGHFKITVGPRDSTSWADTFLQQDGAFRFIGFGAWPFWVWQDGTEGAAPKAGSFSTLAVLISRVNPAYPQEAKSKKVEGNVVVRLIIDKEGSVKKADVRSGDPLLAQAALDAVRQWRYKPATLGGAPCESATEVTINFTLH